MQLFACQNFTSEINIVENTLKDFFIGCKKTFQKGQQITTLLGKKYCKFHDIDEEIFENYFYSSFIHHS